MVVAARSEIALVMPRRVANDGALPGEFPRDDRSTAAFAVVSFELRAGRASWGRSAAHIPDESRSGPPSIAPRQIPPIG
jgi:hypothetical protein